MKRLEEQLESEFIQRIKEKHKRERRSSRYNFWVPILSGAVGIVLGTFLPEEATRVTTYGGALTGAAIGGCIRGLSYILK